MGVPLEVGEGKATVKVSFPGLKSPQVAASVGEVRVQKAPPEADHDDGMGGR